MEDEFDIDPTQDEPEAPAADAAAGKTANDDTKDEAAQLRAELASERERRAEAERNAQYWAERGRSAAPAAPAAKDEPEDDVDLVEIITKQGPKGLDAVLAKRGFLTADQVDARINSARALGAQEARVMAKYPDLEDKNSELFKATAAEYQRLTRDPALKNSPLISQIAVELASSKLEAKRGGQRESEPERQRRVASQQNRSAATRGTGRGQDQASGDLDADQLAMIEKFRAAGATSLTEDSYRKRAQAGVRMGGMPTGRRK